MKRMFWKTLISEERMEECFEQIGELIEKKIQVKLDKLSPKRRKDYHRLVFHFYQSPRTHMHEEWELFRKPYAKDREKVLKLELDEFVSRCEEPWILTIRRISSLWDKDSCIVVSSTIRELDDRNKEKFKYEWSIFIYRSKTPETYERALKNLNMLPKKSEMMSY